MRGRVLDDSFLGEAQISSEVIGRRISYTKRYFTSSPDSINYTGTLSEDEAFMQGQWSIAQWDSGKWEARRSGEDLMASLQTRRAKQVSLTGG